MTKGSHFYEFDSKHDQIINLPRIEVETFPYRTTCVPRPFRGKLQFIELFKITSFTVDRSHGSRHVAGKCILRYPIWYRQRVAENVDTGQLGAALVTKIMVTQQWLHVYWF